MRSIPSLLALLVICLILSAPLFLLYGSNVGNAGSHSEQWALFASASVYGLVIITNRPRSVYDVACKFGLERRVLKCALASVMLIMLSAPLMDNDNQTIGMIGLGCLVIAALVFVFALNITMSAKYSE